MQIALISGAFALLGALFGTLLTGVFNLRAKRNEYVNDYYKTVIQRRIAAYEQLESLIIAFKTAVVDQADMKAFHQPFSGDSHRDDIFTLIGSTLSQGLWLSDKAVQKTIDLNYLLFRMPDAPGSLITFGKAHYSEIAELRAGLERILAADMLKMHEVRHFLSQKAKQHLGFHDVQLYPPDAPKSS
jgi:hypothetical protein